VPRRIASVVGAVGTVLFLLSACGGGGEASIRSGDRRAVEPQAATSGSVAAAGLRTVTYQGTQFDVPADWPVYDLTKDPTRCVRFDTHAVYLGHPGADMACPAGIVGRTDTVLVEPSSGSAHEAAGASAAATTVNGLAAEVADGGNATAEIDAKFPSAGVSATLSYRDSDTTAQQILHSFRVAAK
jgi:hypothetical protein